MRARRLLAFGSALILAISVAGCDKDGDDSSGSGSEGTTPRERPEPVPEQPEAQCPGPCFTMLAGLNEYPRLAVWSVGYGTSDYIRVKNLSGDTISFDGWYSGSSPQRT